MVLLLAELPLLDLRWCASVRICSEGLYDGGSGICLLEKSLIKKPWEGASIYAWRPLLLSPRFCFQVHLFIIGFFGALWYCMI
jgi:hypothetical protein